LAASYFNRLAQQYPGATYPPHSAAFDVAEERSIHDDSAVGQIGGGVIEDGR